MKKTVAFFLALAMMISLCAIFSGCSLIHVQDGFYFWEIYDGENNEEVIGYKISGCTKKVKKKDVIEIPSEIRGKPVLSITGSEDGFEGALATKIIVPEGVTRIVDGFENCPNLKTVELPDSLIEMFEDVFEGSPNVGTVENGFHYVDHWVVDRVESDQYLLRDDTEGIADFVDLRGIQDAEGNIHFPEGLRSIGDKVLKDAVITGDVTFPSTIQKMGYTVLEDAKVSGTVTFSSGIGKVYNNVLYKSEFSRVVLDCTALYFEDGGWEGVFPNCKIGELVVNSSSIGYAASVAQYGMSYAKIDKITTHGAVLPYLIATPDTLEVTSGSIPQGAFKQNNLTTLILGEGVTSVGPTAFAGCQKLKSLTVQNANLTLGAQAFYQTEITSVMAPASVIGSLPTAACTKLMVTSGAVSADTLVNASKITDLTLHNAVTTVAAGALSGCTSLKIAKAPARFVAELPKTKLEDLTVTGGTSLDGAALTGATALTKVTLSKELTAIGTDAFANTTALKAVYYGGTVADWAKIHFASATANPLSFAKSLYIDNSVVIEALDLATVSSYAFTGYAALAQVTFASTLTKIGEGAFTGCTGLVSLALGSALTEIGLNAFGGCDNIAEVSFATTEGWYRFESASSITGSLVSDYYLTDAARAATALVFTYADNVWKKI
ncbi:MAG: leucine-rich repeat protein [Clostridia bacterium]|nr:leucine-rich repeat protein [Clostridia bacterium]